MALLCSANAQARAPDVHFVWQRPPTSLCPTRAVLEADVEALMGRPVFGPAADARVIVRGAVEDGPAGVVVRIEAADAQGRALGARELSAKAGRCAGLRDAIVLVLTLFVEYEQRLLADTEVELGWGAQASLADGPLPRFAFAVGPTLLVGVGPVLRLHASAAYWLPVAVQTARGVGATFDAVSLELRACASIWAGLELCAGAEGGALMSRPLQLRGPARQTRLLAQGSLDASWALRLGSLVRVDLGAGALISFSRPEFSYMRADGARMAVHRPRAVGMIFQTTFIILGP